MKSTFSEMMSKILYYTKILIRSNFCIINVRNVNSEHYTEKIEHKVKTFKVCLFFGILILGLKYLKITGRRREHKQQRFICKNMITIFYFILLGESRYFNAIIYCDITNVHERNMLRPNS